MRHLVRRLSVGVCLFVSVLPISFFGQSQGSKKPKYASVKAESNILHTDEGPAHKVKGPVSRDRRAPSGQADGANGAGAVPVEAPTFRVMSHPREEHLMRGHSFSAM
jgi:hypothetical protein